MSELVCVKRPTKTSVGHMETRPRLRASYDRLEEREIELRTPVCKASGLHIHYNMSTIYGYLHLIYAQTQEFLPGGGGGGGGESPSPTARKQF